MLATPARPDALPAQGAPFTATRPPANGQGRQVRAASPNNLRGVPVPHPTDIPHTTNANALRPTISKDACVAETEGLTTITPGGYGGSDDTGSEKTLTAHARRHGTSSARAHNNRRVYAVAC